MGRISRRTFIKNSAVAASGAVALAPHSRVLGANDELRVAVVGFRGHGSLHIRLLRELPGVRVVALCDADERVLERGLQQARDQNEKVAGYVDVRELLENKNIDVITTATPNHWHALVSIWACQAGKDVYVEKPLCLNVFEGRKMVEAARKYDRIVQFGNQNHAQATGDMRLEVENLGKIQVAYTALNRMRQSIGRVTEPQPVPDSINYDLWTGPAPLQPLMRQRLHYDWHWVWPTGSGEIGNNGIYPLDACRLALGQKVLPKRVMSLGGRFLFDDDGETPNAQLAFFQYEPGPMVIFELRNFPSDEGPRSIGSRIKCEHGETSLPRPTGTPGDTGGFPRHQGHLYNFLSAVRSRNVSDLRADVLEGHLSTAMVSMANASYRVGTPHSVNQAREIVHERGSEAAETFDGFVEHLTVNGVDFSNAKMIVGPWLEMDNESEQFVGQSDVVAHANQIIRGTYRGPFVVPDTV